MRITQEINLPYFEFWGAAKYTVERLSFDDLERLDDILTDEYPDGIDATELNDIFAFEEDFIANLLGFENWEELETNQDKSDFLNWLYEHKQAYEDFCDHFDIMPNEDESISYEDCLDWLHEHKQLTEDYKKHIGKES